MLTLTRLQKEGMIPWAEIIYSHMVIMTRIKTVTLSMPDNIYRVLEYAEVPCGCS